MESILFDSSKDKEDDNLKKTQKIAVDNSLPTPEQMAKLASSHPKELWAKFCESKSFMNALTTDIKLAGILAEKIRNGKKVD